LNKRVSNAGQPSYKGYEYQIEITVWCALELIFRQKKYSHLIVEPASHEDIEAISINDANSFSEARNKSQKLIIQVKSRFNKAISLNDFKKIIVDKPGGSKGPKPRTRPLDIIDQDKNALYVLITDGIMSNNKSLCVETLGEKSKAKELPKSLAKETNTEFNGRITILEGKQLQLAYNDSLTILHNECHVPFSASSDCYKDLKECVRDRLLGKENAEWTKEQILEVLNKHGALPSLTKKMSIYVPPNNFENALKLFEKNNFILIYGKPGIGKSSLAEYLLLHYQKSSNPDVVTNYSYPAEIRKALRKPGPMIILLDDPWGKTKPSADSEMWRNEIPKLLEDATIDKKFIIVSRESILKEVWPFEASLPTILKSSTFSLTANDYSEKEFLIIKQKLRDLNENASAWHDKKIQMNWSRLLKELPEPAGFVEAINLIYSSNSNDRIDFKEIINQCNSKNLIDTYSSYIYNNHSSEDIKAFFLIWALFLITPKSTLQYKYRQVLTENSFVDELNNFLNWLDRMKGHNTIPARSIFNTLKEIDWIVTDDLYGLHFYDTRIEAAFEAAITVRPDETSWVINSILEYLTSEKKFQNALKIVENLASRRVKPHRNLLLSIEEWLLEMSLNGHINSFSEAFTKFGYWGVSEEPEAIFARAFHPSKYSDDIRKKVNFFESEFDFSVWTSEDIALISNNYNCVKLASRILETSFKGCCNFSSTALPIITKFDELFNRNKTNCDILAKSCIKGLSINSHQPFLFKALIKGVSLWGSEEDLLRVYNIIKQHYEENERWFKEWSNNDAKDLEQGVYNAEYESHLLDIPPDSFIPINDALEEVIYFIGIRKGYKWLVEVAQTKFFEYAVSALSRMKNGDELNSSFEACFKLATSNYDLKNLYLSIGKGKCYDLEYILFDGIKSENIENVKGALSGFAALYMPEEFKKKVDLAISSLNFVQKIRLKEALDNIEPPIKPFSADEWINSISISFDQNEELLFNKINKENFNERELKKIVLSLTKLDIILLESLVQAIDLDASNPVLLILTHLDDSKYTSVVNNWLNNEDPQKRYYAYATLSIKNFKILLRGLTDEDYRCRRIVLSRLSELAIDRPGIRKRIVRMAITDKSAPVREYCINIIGKYKLAEGIPNLLKLLEDKRDIAQGSSIDNFDHHVARASVWALLNFNEFKKIIYPTLLKILKSGKPIQEDYRVHLLILNLFKEWKLNEAQDYLIELLKDDWYVKGNNNSCYVRRLFSAWTLLHLDIEKNIPLIMDNISIQDPEIAAPLLIAIINSTNDYQSILDIAKKKEKNDKLPWLKLATSMIYAKTRDLNLVKKFASSEFLPWFEYLEKNPQYFNNIPYDILNGKISLLNEIVDATKEAQLLKTAIFYSISQWMGEGWIDVLKNLNLYKDFILESQLPDFMPVISIWNLSGCE
jgi:energy-coupling factor transporter ATP-binding protein EcfA2